MRPDRRRRFGRSAGWAGLLSGLVVAAGCGGSSPDDTPGTAYWAVAAADFDGDGRIDLAGSFSGDGAPPHPGHVAVFLQRTASPGGFMPARDYRVGNDPFGLVAGDFDGDGRIDLATDNTILATSGAGIDDLSILLQSAVAPGAYLPAISCAGVYGDGRPAPADPLCTTLHLPTGFSPKSLQADLNGDGLADQVTADSGSVEPGCTAFDCHFIDSSVAVSLQDPKAPGRYLAAVNYLPRDGGFVASVAAADVDGDGRPDLVVGQSNGLYVRLQDGSDPGRFLAPILVSR